MDDIITYSASTDKYLQYLSLVLEQLKKYTLSIKLGKCKVLQSKVVFLGYANKE